MKNLALLVDATSIFSFQQYLKEHEYVVQGNINYAALLDALQEEFPDDDFNLKVAFVSIDLEHEGQKKFRQFLVGKGFTVDATDYRDCFILPDRSSPYQRLSARITY